MSLFKKLVLISAVVFASLATTQAYSAKSSIETRIVGGTQSGSSDWPWIVALSRSDSTVGNDLFQNQFCGGSLINESWVLTAAHCVVDTFGDPISTSGVHAFVGEYDLNNSTGEYRAVDLVIVHPDYNSTTTDNDIALLRLATPSAVTPVALIDSSVAATLETLVDDPNNNTDFTVIGWGSLTEDQTNPTYPSILEDVDLPYISNSECNNSALSGQVTDNMICAGFPNGGFDSCQGDSGGPLVYSSGGQLSGIVSWGVGCAQADSYGVYTRLSNYIAWIDSILNGYIITPNIQFGSWLSNTTITANLSIQNSSSSALTLNSFSTPANSAFTVLGNNCSSIVSVDATCVVTVEFASGSLNGAVTDAVTIGTDSATVPVITVPLEATVVTETFFSNAPAPISVRWALSGNNVWTQEQVTTNGSLSFESGNINDSQTSSLYAYFDLASTENVYFDWKACSEPSYDFLELWVDNVKISGISGDTDWTRTSVSLSGGTPHVIEWRYNKDYSYSYGNDAGWINNIAIGLTAANQNSLPVHSSSCDLSVTDAPQPMSSGGGSMSGWVYLMFGLPLIMRRRFRKH